MRKLLLALCLFTTLFAEEMTVQSESAHYDGDRIILIGDVIIESGFGTVMAEKAILLRDGEEIEGTFRPTKITLEGNVRMIRAEAAQYALADWAEYYPNEKRLLLTSKSKVLFFDKEKEIQMVAPAILALDNGQSIEGIGNVRFVFKSDELEKIKNQFKGA
ncbi:MAG: hypothetical protein KR126chlam2_00861 [Chlamydiae bacterium]|nr:hypothetical protein [Chlamydiota bacterium]